MNKLTNIEARALFREEFRDCSDSVWYRTKKVFDDETFPMTAENIRWVAKIKTMLPKLDITELDIVSTVKFTNKLLNTAEQKTTGQELLDLLKQYEIVVHANTLTAWFRKLGGFSRRRPYTTSELTPVILAAFSYKLKNQLKGLTTYGN